MLAGGADISIVSKRLGHSSIRVTSDLCTHLMQGGGPGAHEATKMATDLTMR